MKLIFSIVFILVCISLTSAFEQSEWDFEYVAPAFNNGTAFVNASSYWFTLDHGPLNTVAQIMLSWITNDLGWSVDTNASTCSDGDYLDGSGLCIDLNATIEDKIRSIEYNASVFAVPAGAGTIDAGNLLSIQIAGDDDWLNISEDAGVIPNLDLQVNFTGIENFNSVQFDVLYDDGGGHQIQIGIWDCDDNDYEFGEYQPNIVDMDNLARLSRNVFDPASHICTADRNVSVIFTHLNIGNQNHNFHMDDIKLIQGASISSPVEVDPFSLHTSGDNAMMGNLDMNGNNITNATWINEVNFQNLTVIDTEIIWEIII